MIWNEYFFLCLGGLSCSFLTLDQVPTFHSLHFQYCEIFLRVPVMQSFCWCHFCSIFILFSQPLSSFVSISLPSLSSSGCISGLSSGNKVNIVMVSYFFYNSVYVWLGFYFQHYYFFKKFLFYWSIVDLQCCINFYCKAKWFGYTYIHSFSYSFPSWFITGYWI